MSASSAWCRWARGSVGASEPMITTGPAARCVAMARAMRCAEIAVALRLDGEPLRLGQVLHARMIDVAGDREHAPRAEPLA